MKETVDAGVGVAEKWRVLAGVRDGGGLEPTCWEAALIKRPPGLRTGDGGM